MDLGSDTFWGPNKSNIPRLSCVINGLRVLFGQKNTEHYEH